MLFRVFGLIFLFLIRLRFPPHKSIAQVIKNRYGEVVLKHLRKFEKNEFKKRKCELDLEFLLTCQQSNVIPTFLKFRVANRNLHGSSTYRTCQ